MYDNGLRFESDVHLSKVSAPIMILHAEDDIVIPIDLGEKVILLLFVNYLFIFFIIFVVEKNTGK